MNDYSLIESTLAGIYSVSVGYSEEEAIREFEKDLELNLDFRREIAQEIQSAFSDDGLSWKDLLAKHDVLYSQEESEARDYAKRILWDVVNP